MTIGTSSNYDKSYKQSRKFSTHEKTHHDKKKPNVAELKRLSEVQKFKKNGHISYNEFAQNNK